ncbi:MAG: fatty acid desaturase [Candidatus Sericytochromatia bacterium]|nr:fatty acid desaturase [Candidatus Tanganyikabacteria bacterium]
MNALMRPPVDPAVMRDCTRISPWKSLALCMGVYAAAVAIAWACGGRSGWVLAPVGILLIAGLQMHLLILLHEGAHLLLHPNRKINDLIGDIFCAVPLLLLLKNYRVLHLTHHKYSGQPARDPEARLYAGQGYHYARRPGPAALRMLLADLSGLNAMKFVRDLNSWLAEQRAAGRVKDFEPRDYALIAGIWLPVAAAAWAFGFWPELLVFWVLPQPTVMFFFLKIHGYGEHTGASGPTEFERTWIHETHPVEDYFIAPIYSGYHLEHHLFPRVPWYHMARFRRHLLSLPEFADRANPVTVRSYLFGRRSILRLMVWGAGEYRTNDLGAQTAELATDDVVSADCKAEVDEQLAALTPTAAHPL